MKSFLIAVDARLHSCAKDQWTCKGEMPFISSTITKLLLCECSTNAGTIILPRDYLAIDTVLAACSVLIIVKTKSLRLFLLLQLRL